MKTLLVTASTIALLGLVVPARASDCTDALNKNDSWIQNNQDVRDSLDPVEQRDIRQLRAAAQTLDRNGQEEACQKVADAIRDMAETSHDQMQQDTSDSSASNDDRLAKAVSVTQGGVRADEVIGSSVRNPQGKDLGQVQDVVLGGADGGRSYAIVTYGGFLGLGEDHIAVPLEVLKITQDHEVVVLDMTKDQFESAPRYKDDEEGSISDPQWRQTNDAFFGID